MFTRKVLRTFARNALWTFSANVIWMFLRKVLSISLLNVPGTFHRNIQRTLLWNVQKTRTSSKLQESSLNVPMEPSERSMGTFREGIVLWGRIFSRDLWELSETNIPIFLNLNLRIWNLSVEKKTLSTALGFEPRSYLNKKISKIQKMLLFSQFWSDLAVNDLVLSFQALKRCAKFVIFILN